MGSVWYAGFLIVGGLGSTVGPFLGSAFIVLMSEGLSLTIQNFTTAIPRLAAIIAPLNDVIFGLIVALFLIYEPRGLAHRWELMKTSYRLWPYSY